jgi:hypothetical protein
MLKNGLNKYLISIIALMLLSFPTNCHSQDSESNNDSADSIVTKNDTDSKLINVDPDHPYLNSIDWMIVQPLDMSSAKITTTAKSTATEVHFTHQCEEVETTTILFPDDGMVSDTLDTTCNSLLTTQITAYGDDMTIETIQTIDLQFLNSLGNNNPSEQ